jgi:hypothetical protein
LLRAEGVGQSGRASRCAAACAENQHTHRPQKASTTRPPLNITKNPLKTGFLQQHKARLAREIASLRRQAEAVNTPATYAKCAKLQRLANAKEQELGALQQHSDGGARARIAMAVATLKVRGVDVLLFGLLFVGCRLFLSSPPTHETNTSQQNAFPAMMHNKQPKTQLVTIALAVACLWGRAVLYIPPRLSWPFGRLLLFPHASGGALPAGAVTVVPWVALCDRASLLLARALFPLRGLEPRTRPLSTVHEEKEH